MPAERGKDSKNIQGCHIPSKSLAGSPFPSVESRTPPPKPQLPQLEGSSTALATQGKPPMCLQSTAWGSALLAQLKWKLCNSSNLQATVSIPENALLTSYSEARADGRASQEYGSLTVLAWPSASPNCWASFVEAACPGECIIPIQELSPC